jgi:hypothetical protein
VPTIPDDAAKPHARRHQLPQGSNLRLQEQQAVPLLPGQQSWWWRTGVSPTCDDFYDNHHHDDDHNHDHDYHATSSSSSCD